MSDGKQMMSPYFAIISTLLLAGSQTDGCGCTPVQAIPFYRAAADTSLALKDTTDAFLDFYQAVFNILP